MFLEFYWLIVLYKIFVIDNPRTTEIIIVTGNSNKSNVTIKQEDVDIVFQLRNKTSHSFVPRKKRSLDKDKLKRNLQLHDEAMEKARAVIHNHDATCDSQNPNEFCKSLVNKLDEVTNTYNADSGDGIKLNLRGLHENYDKPTTRHTISEISKLDLPNFAAQERSGYPDVPQYFPVQTLPVLPVLPTLPQLQHLPVIHPPVADTCLLARLLKHNPQHLQGLWPS